MGEFVYHSSSIFLKQNTDSPRVGAEHVCRDEPRLLLSGIFNYISYILNYCYELYYFQNNVSTLSVLRKNPTILLFYPGFSSIPRSMHLFMASYSNLCVEGQIIFLFIQCHFLIYLELLPSYTHLLSVQSCVVTSQNMSVESHQPPLELWFVFG